MATCYLSRLQFLYPLFVFSRLRNSVHLRRSDKGIHKRVRQDNAGDGAPVGTCAFDWIGAVCDFECDFVPMKEFWRSVETAESDFEELLQKLPLEPSEALHVTAGDVTTSWRKLCEARKVFEAELRELVLTAVDKHLQEQLDIVEKERSQRKKNLKCYF
jgi:hypothetical protein